MASLARASETLAAEDAGKAAPDTPKHPGWPAGAPDSQGGKFRPKTPDEVAADRTERAKSTTPKAGSGMTEILAEAVKTAIRGFLSRAESAPHPGVRIAAFLAEVGLEAYPYVIAYFGEAKPLEELQAAAQEPSQTGYEDHHIVEQATANPDGSEDRQMEAPDNLARIPTVKHLELNRWYKTPNYSLEGLTPRKYLDGKSWEGAVPGRVDGYERYWSVEMNDAPYSALSIEDLLKQFEQACLIQYDTFLNDDLDTYNREYKKLDAIKDELNSRGASARRALLRLFLSGNKQVRLMAAQRVYPVARVEAKACLQTLSDGPFPDDQVFAARMCLRRLEEAPDCLDH